MQTKQKQKILKLGHGHFYVLVTSFLFFVTVLAGILLRTTPTISRVNAVMDADAVTGSQEGCSFTGTVSSAHSATISIGESEADFGTTKITTVCANSVDHQVYAVGFTDETEGNTNLVNTNDSNLLIPTGIETGNISNWSMKISKDTSSYLPENLSIENDFNSNHVVPNESTLISSYTGGTDSSVGSSIMTTYSARSSNTQVKGEYTGKVKYTLTATMTYSVTIKTVEGIDKVTLNGVECTSTDGCIVTGLISGQSYTLEVTPSSGYGFTEWDSVAEGTIGSATSASTTYTVGNDNEVLVPNAEVLIALLDTGQNVNAKMKKVANGLSGVTYSTSDTKIKAVQRSSALPNDFTATTNNTVSLATSSVPIYIFFDNTNNAGIMYYYAENNASIIANPNSGYMFYYMKSLTDIVGSSDWDTSQTTIMDNMFYGDSSLADISGVSNWDTAEVISMSSMFGETGITNVDALATGKNGNPNIWNTGNVTSMSSMFYRCTSLADIAGLSNWDTSEVVNMGNMFGGYQYGSIYSNKITNLDALAAGKNNNPNVWNTGNVTNMSNMFHLSTSLTDIAGLSDWNTENVTDMESMFSSCTSLTNIAGLYNWNTGSVTNMSHVFYYCTSLADIAGVSNWDTSKVTDTNNMFYKTKITNLNALATGKNNNPSIWNTGNVTDMSTMFSTCTSLTDITGLSNWDTSEVINMSLMFYDSSSLTIFSGLSNWDTAKVTDMHYMFFQTGITNTSALAAGKDGNPNIWNTGNVENMSGMFCGTQRLTDITGLSNWNTANVTDMNEMFRYSKITNLDALAPGKDGNPNIWNTGNVTNMMNMFQNDTSLTNISGIVDWDVSSVTFSDTSNRFRDMFRNTGATLGGFSFTNRPGSFDNDGTYIPNS